MVVLVDVGARGVNLVGIRNLCVESPSKFGLALGYSWVKESVSSPAMNHKNLSDFTCLFCPLKGKLYCKIFHFLVKSQFYIAQCCFCAWKEREGNSRGLYR